jgi:N-acetylmuramoyl-L-alanine amidase/Mannosyl-glycoprotein endo-beta-N-acetylglucosaminidase
MGKIFISAGHGGFEGGLRDRGAIVASSTEAEELIATRDLIVAEIKSRGITVEAPGDDLSLVSTIAWINARASRQDVALEIHMDAFSNANARGASAYYIANNSDRKRQAEMLINSLIRRVPELPSRGAKPDTAAAVGRLGFCRDLIPPSMLVELGFLTSPQDLRLIQTRRRDFAIGLADGLQAWLREVAEITLDVKPVSGPNAGEPTVPSASGASYPEANIDLNGQLYEEKAILVSGNAYIPIDLVDRLSIDVIQAPNVRRLRYKNVIYVQAIALRDYNLSVSWDAKTRIVYVRSIFKICAGQIDQIMGHGNTSEIQMLMFLKHNNEVVLERYGEIAQIYREEATIEGVNYDVAFCQMCVETGFLRFGGDVKPEQNNFAGLGAVGSGAQGPSFSDQRTGVRAQIQHLKAYASTAPLVQTVVDPRFRFVTRGVAPLVSQLTGRWAADSNYDKKIMATLRRLYEESGLL